MSRWRRATVSSVGMHAYVRDRGRGGGAGGELMRNGPGTAVKIAKGRRISDAIVPVPVCNRILHY